MSKGVSHFGPVTDTLWLRFWPCVVGRGAMKDNRSSSTSYWLAFAERRRLSAAKLWKVTAIRQARHKISPWFPSICCILLLAELQTFSREGVTLPLPNLRLPAPVCGAACRPKVTRWPMSLASGVTCMWSGQEMNTNQRKWGSSTAAGISIQRVKSVTALVARCRLAGSICTASTSVQHFFRSISADSTSAMLVLPHSFFFLSWLFALKISKCLYKGVICDYQLIRLLGGGGGVITLYYRNSWWHLEQKLTLCALVFSFNRLHACDPPRPPWLVNRMSPLSQTFTSVNDKLRQTSPL